MGSDFHVGQTLFFMDNNNICKSKLTEIILSISTESQQEEYVLNNDKEVWRRTKSALFLSKDELIQSLLDYVKEWLILGVLQARTPSHFSSAIPFPGSEEAAVLHYIIHYLYYNLFSYLHIDYL